MNTISILFLLQSLLTLINADNKPIARNLLYIVEMGKSSIIQMSSYFERQRKDGTFTPSNVQYILTDFPSSGSFYQLSKNYLKYGYTPISGVKIRKEGNTTVTKEASGKVFYERPIPDHRASQMWGKMEYVVVDVNGIQSYPASVTLVDTSGVLVSSDYLFNEEGWTISGNINTESYAAKHNSIQLGMLNFFIGGSDTLINVDENGKNEKSLWYFNSPAKFHGNYGIAYKGNIAFTIGSSVGNFSPENLNVDDTKAVILECSNCEGPVHKGITLAITLGLLRQLYTDIMHEATEISIPLDESAGWIKDSQNVNEPWTKATQCDIIQVLSQLSGFRILGDWTQAHETVHIDNVKFKNTKGELPLCAQSVPDASICTCSS